MSLRTFIRIKSKSYDLLFSLPSERKSAFIIYFTFAEKLFNYLLHYAKKSAIINVIYT